MANLSIVHAELVRKFAVEFGYHTNEVLEMFQEYGYVCLGIGRGPVHQVDDMENTDNTNFLFLHRNKHKDILNRYIKENK